MVDPELLGGLLEGVIDGEATNLFLQSPERLFAESPVLRDHRQPLLLGRLALHRRVKVLLARARAPLLARAGARHLRRRRHRRR